MVSLYIFIVFVFNGKNKTSIRKSGQGQSADRVGGSMRSVIFISVLIIGFFGVITAIARPDIISAKYAEIRAPIDRYFAEKNARAWKAAKETERSAWMIHQKLPHDCNLPKSSIREIECNNVLQLQAQTFEKIWSNKLKSGWKPDGSSQ